MTRCIEQRVLHLAWDAGDHGLSYAVGRPPQQRRICDMSVIDLGSRQVLAFSHSRPLTEQQETLPGHAWYAYVVYTLQGNRWWTHVPGLRWLGWRAVIGQARRVWQPARGAWGGQSPDTVPIVLRVS